MNQEFRLLAQPPLDKPTAETLFKLGLADALAPLKFRFRAAYSPADAQQFATALLNQPPVLRALGLPAARTVKLAARKCGRPNLNMFDDFARAGCLNSDGSLREVLPLYHRDVEVSSKLLQLVLRAELDEFEQEADAFASLRPELLFDLLALLLVGGRLCQFEGDSLVLRRALASLYKRLVDVRRNPAGVFLDSEYLLVESVDGRPLGLEHRRFCGVVVNPSLRTAFVLLCCP